MLASMKYLRARKRTSLALLVALVLCSHLANASSEAKSKLTATKKNTNSEPHPIKSGSSEAAVAAGPQSSSIDQKHLVDTSIEAQESAIQPIAVSPASSSGSSGSAPSAASSGSAVASSLDSSNDEEYAQIKPEEVNSVDQAKESSASAGQPEHKSASVEDELNSQLARDTIHEQESSERPYAAAAPRSSSIGGQYTGKIRPYKPNMPSPHHLEMRPYSSMPRVPPHYHAMKGKLTGINPIISQYPHPAPGYPHHGPRHLPRGAAAGYAAFRDFVKAHANKYKPNQSQAGYRPNQASKHQQAAGAISGYQTQQPARTKVTVTQAFIPHLAPQAANGNPQSGYGQSYMTPYNSPNLAKLYGGHAPQGVGRPEYSKDYGMVIHYPQATVYTEPMTVDQLYKLTGGGISQVIEQLQHNLAHGYRDESSMIRPNNKHHLGNGVTIHAKEYQAPGKSGHYVQTTAAVISTGAKGEHEPQASYGSDQPVVSGGELASGYERVKQAVSASQQKYQQSTKSNGYDQSPVNKYHQAEPLSAISGLIGSELESLFKANQALNKQIEPEIHAQIQSFLKSNEHASQGLKYADLDHRSPLYLHKQPMSAAHYIRQPNQGRANRHNRGSRKGNQQRPGRYASSRPHHQRPAHQGRYNSLQQQQQHQPQHQQHQQHQQQQMRYQQQQKAPMNYQQHQQMNAYQATEQALNHQMSQVLHDFHQGEEQYNGKNQPAHATSQGYPQKVLQKHRQQQQYQQQAQPGYATLHEGLEIPQGPNDQVGEIADLLEALKGSLEMSGHTDEQNQQGAYGNDKQQTSELAKDVKYLASALGQTPSYAMQVPVSGGSVAGAESGSGSYQTGAKKVEQQYQQAPQTALPVIPQSYQQQSPTASEPHYESITATKHQTDRQTFTHSDGYAAAVQAAPLPQLDPASYIAQPNGEHYPTAQNTDYQSHSQSAAHQPASPLEAHSIGYSAPIQGSAGSYAQPGPLVPIVESSAAAQSAYQTSEHSSVTNHLVPASQLTPVSPVTPTGAYEASSSPSLVGPSQAQQQQQQHQQTHDNQPANQIAVSAPTESHYQNAQSLSSFVESLPTDYQELLRQPALVSGHSSTPHLAALGHEAPAGSYQTAPSKEASGHSSQSSGHQSHTEEQVSHQQQQHQQQQEQIHSTYQQQAQQASAPVDTSSGSHETQATQQTQYKKA